LVAIDLVESVALFLGAVVDLQNLLVLILEILVDGVEDDLNGSAMTYDEVVLHTDQVPIPRIGLLLVERTHANSHEDVGLPLTVLLLLSAVIHAGPVINFKLSQIHCNHKRKVNELHAISTVSHQF
jgi:hypothetical protein